MREVIVFLIVIENSYIWILWGAFNYLIGWRLENIVKVNSILDGRHFSLTWVLNGLLIFIHILGIFVPFVPYILEISSAYINICWIYNVLLENGFFLIDKTDALMRNLLILLYFLKHLFQILTPNALSQ
jgi:hypothetical protein